MRLIVQRVTNAKIVIEGEEISSVENGLLVLVGISKEDTIEDMMYCARKVLGIRLFENEEGKAWSKSAKDLGYEILFQSQFTLFASVSKGNKPDFHKAMSSETSREFYEKFVEVCESFIEVKALYSPEKIKSGIFQKYTHVHLVNDGPVTVIIDSKNK